MKEYAGFMSKVDLDGEDGDAWIDVRCRVSVPDARKLSKWMMQTGSPLRVLIPSELPREEQKP